jgi:hypothetical protein
MAVKIFFCYARKDKPLLKELHTHLFPLYREGLINMWHDGDISAGAEWEQEISSHLNEAEIILLLISPNFMASDYCYGIEMKRAMERHEKGEARVIPIILRSVNWQSILGKLQALPTDAKPIMRWSTRDEAFYNVVEGIRKVVVELKAKVRFDKFTNRYKVALSLSQEEAVRMNFNSIGSEHLLLGLIREGKGVAAVILTKFHVRLNQARDTVELFIGRGNNEFIGEIGLDTHAKKLIELSVKEAFRLNHYYVGTGHLLLSIIDDGQSEGFKVLKTLIGNRMEKMRKQIIDEIHPD